MRCYSGLRVYGNAVTTERLDYVSTGVTALAVGLHRSRIRFNVNFTSLGTWRLTSLLLRFGDGSVQHSLKPRDNCKWMTACALLVGWESETRGKEEVHQRLEGEYEARGANRYCDGMKLNVKVFVEPSEVY